jgi:leucyl-tRNA synthetase
MRPFVDSAQHIEHTNPIGRLAKKGVAQKVKDPTHATIWIARSYPSWKGIILKSLQGSLADGRLPDKKKIYEILSGVPEIKDINFEKKVMPFVQAVKNSMDKKGKEALKQNVDLDEESLLNMVIPYLKNNLQLQYIEIKYSSADDPSADEKPKQECSPGTPLISFKDA